MTIGAGRLNTRLVLQELVSDDNGRGDRTAGVWSTVGPVYAEARPLSGTTALQNLVSDDEQTWRVTIRFNAIVTGAHRFLHGSRVLEIVGQPEDPDGRRAKLVMTCIERKASPN